MSLYTGKGDGGTTKTFGCNQRISKSSAITEALGSLDEINSFLGICKVKAKESGFLLGEKSFASIVGDLQQSLFLIQAEMAGSTMTTAQEKVAWASALVDAGEKELPPITTFFVSGGTELAAIFDVSRTLARRAERRVVGVAEEGKIVVGPHTLAFLNRLSSVLYVLARLSNHKSGIIEEKPTYK